jgi:stage II sporulation protein D
MRRLVLLGIVVTAALCAAQQPEVRVRLLSLYRLQEVTIAPGANTQIRWSANANWQPLHSSLAVHVRGDGIEAAGHSGASMGVKGDFQIVSTARMQPLHVPLEISAREGSLRIVASLPMEEYVSAVLQGETAGDMPGEALKALAVAIRSYATHFRERHKSEGFDFCDTTHCQYLRLDTVASVRVAVEQTRGELLWDKGTPLAAYYHKDCGGRTEAASVVWPDQHSQALASRADPYCVRAAVPWRAEIAPEDLDSAMKHAGLTVPRGWNRITIVDRTPSGRARTLRFSGSSGMGAPVSASSLRFAVGRSMGWNTLKSDWYEVSKVGGRFVFAGKGVGHGVGLCQTGAAEMARQGKRYREILAFYYAGASVGRSAQGIPWSTAREAEFDVLTVNPGDIAIVQKTARSALGWAEQQTGLPLRVHPAVEVFPSVAMFRDATGEPGWVAASTHRYHVAIEPPSVLGDRLEGTLRHEFLHILVESNARASTPLWFREGLVLFLSGERQEGPSANLTPEQIEAIIGSRRSQAEMKAAYGAVTALVAELDRQWGRAELMRWLRDGIPGGVLSRSGVPVPNKVSH